METSFLKTDAALWTLIALAFLLRAAGIGYGLPLTLVADEPPFVLASLQMLQTHTVIPALNADAFKNILYYPPYISYLYLLPFTAVTAVLYLFWHEGSALFSAHLLSNLSVFFLTARFLSAALGAFAVYLVYRVAQSLYLSRIGAAVAGFLLATSLIHESLSMVGRHWLPISCIFLLVLYILTREQLPENRRIFYALLIAGIGMGISTFSVVALVPIALWFSLISNVSARAALRDRWILSGALLFIVLAPIPSLLYPYSQGFLSGVLLLHGQTTLAGFLTSPLHALLRYAYAEPVLIGLFLAGLPMLWFHSRRWFIFFGTFFLFYVLLFYLLTVFETRFLLPLVPVYALVGGYAGHSMSRTKAGTVVLIALLLVPLAGAVRLSMLAYNNDTRIHARDWALQELKPSDKVLVYAELMRLPVNKASVDELRSIDPTAIRKTDEAGAALNRADMPHALNLYAVQNKDFLQGLAAYARSHGYRYLIVDASYNEPAPGATVIKKFDGLGDGLSIANSSFILPLPALFAPKSLGPTILVYKLKY